MSNHIAKAYKDGNGSSGTSLHSPGSSWMSRWSNAPSNQGSLVAPHPQAFSRDEVFDHTQKSLRTNHGVPRSYGTLRNTTKSENAGLAMGSPTRKPPLCLLGSRNRKNTQTASLLDPTCVQVADKSSVLESNPSTATRILATHERDGNFANHFSNTDFISLDQRSTRHEKYSAIVVHERSAFSPLHSDNQFDGMQIDRQDDATVRNVDYEGNSHGLYSRTTTHHVLFSTHESTRHRGVKIQPLWSTTDSEKDNYGDAETPRFGKSFDLSAETDTLGTIPLPNDNNSSGMHFSPIAKHTMETDKNVAFAFDGGDPWEDKVRGKLGVSETPSSSRTESMETDNLVCCAEKEKLYESRTFPIPYREKCSLQEADCKRSVKRIKLSSSPLTSSQEKASGSMVGVMGKQGGSSDSPCSLRRKKNPIFESCWIQRWCQEKDPGERVMACEPESLDEVEKKRFPSIAAVAMMGKSVDGLHACTYTKRGPLVLWNSKPKDY